MSYTVVHPAFLDCQAEATGSHAAGTTTWTFTTERPYTIALYKPTGAAITLSTVDNLNFTASGNYSAGAAILGVGYDFDVFLPEPIARDENGSPEMSDQFNVIWADITFTDAIKADVYVKRMDGNLGVTDFTTQTFTNEGGVGSFGLVNYQTYRVSVMGPAERTIVQVSSPDNYPYPVTVTGVEYRGNRVTFPR